MTSKFFLLLSMSGIACGAIVAQSTSSAMPDRLLIARHTFMDCCGPNDFYEIIQVVPNGADISVVRAFVTPAGPAACLQPAKVEFSSGLLHESMESLLSSKNPCTIPEKDLRKEQKRRKQHLVFSGVNVTMQTECEGTDRMIRMDILDRDLFDPAPGTPRNTSWTMSVLSKLDSVLGPGAWDKPIFSLDSQRTPPILHNEIFKKLTTGDFDSLFNGPDKVSEIAKAAANGPPSPPTIEIESVLPTPPTVPELPVYPPIARLARVEGLVIANFMIDQDGVARNITFASEPRLKMLEAAVSESISKWKFPESAWGQTGNASIRFSLNCRPTTQTTVSNVRQ